jgi:hypothetical protein
MTTMELSNEFKKAIWTLVVASFVALGANFWQNVSFQAKHRNQIEILRTETDILRLKVDVLDKQIERKVDRETLDNCLSSINNDINELRKNQASNFNSINQNLMNILEKLPRQ